MKRLIIIEDTGIKKWVEDFLIHMHPNVIFNSGNEKNNVAFAKLLQLLQQDQSSKKIFFNENTNILPVGIEEIIRIESLPGNSQIFLRGKKPIFCQDTLTEFEGKLSNYPFVKINTSTIINLMHILDISFSDAPVVTLSDGHKVFFKNDTALLIEKYFNKLTI